MNESTPVKKLSLDQMKKEVLRAEAERRGDEQAPKLSYTENLGSKLPYHTETKQNRGVVVSSHNARPYQEDRAEFIMCDSVFAKQFHALDIEQKAALLYNEILKITKETADFVSGTTLTASVMWTTKDEVTGKFTSHVITAHIGDSRAVKCTDDKATRLTRHHSLLRKHERDELALKGFEIKEPQSPEYYGYETVLFNVFQNNQLTAQQTNDYFRVGGGYGLAMTRSLGDSPIHKRSPALRSHADFSYRATPMESNPYLVSSSDGITDCVSDENLREILREANGNCKVAALNTVRLAHQRHSHDNMSCIVTPLSSISPGEVAFQFVADGHGGSETVDHVAQSLRKFPYKADVKLSPALMVYRRYNDPEINNILDKVEAGEINEVDATEQLKPLGDKLIRDQTRKDARDELNQLISMILAVNKHEKNKSDKYQLMRDFSQKIKAKEFKDISEIEAAARNFFCLALQRNYIGLLNTTDSGLEIKKLLNEDPAYGTLKKELFKQEGNIQYREIRAFVTGDKAPEDEHKNKRLFSGLNRKKACEFWKEVVKTDNGIAINNIPAVINKIRPVR